jgi:hypothetical protein
MSWYYKLINIIPWLINILIINYFLYTLNHIIIKLYNIYIYKYLSVPYPFIHSLKKVRERGGVKLIMICIYTILPLN